MARLIIVLCVLVVVCAMLTMLHPMVASVLQISFARYELTADEVSQLYTSRGLCIGELVTILTTLYWA